MKTIEQLDLENKNVVIRLDYNVPIKDNVIQDDTKIRKTLPTLKYLLSKNARIVILSHLGRIKNEADKKNNTLKPVAKRLAELLDSRVKFINACYGNNVKEEVLRSKNKEVILLENTRFMDLPTKRESQNDLELAKFWSLLGDVFINDAFASLHRIHASTAGICQFLPHGIGFLVMHELNNLNILINNTPHPFTIIMGGAKIDDKLMIIKNLLPRCDNILLTGALANSFLKAKGEDIGTSLATMDEEILVELRKIIECYPKKIILPIDFVTDNNCIYDIGLKTIDLFQEYINNSAIIFVNGTCGKYEDERYQKGTEELFRVLKESQKKVIIGGGDALNACQKFGYQNDFSFLSSGGGATLEYIADQKLAALEWIDK